MRLILTQDQVSSIVNDWFVQNHSEINFMQYQVDEDGVFVQLLVDYDGITPQLPPEMGW